jgi:hypothetical protein
LKRTTTLLAMLILSGLLPACATSEKDNAAREWQRNECNQIIDGEARGRCMKRVDETYGKGR